jgi:3-hydroxybutyryl-CoA dehydratase
MKLNETFEYQFSFSQEDVDNFAKVTGDDNPIHIDEEYAQKSIFKKRIVHGFLSGSVFSKVFGTMWPGNGTIYLNQKMSFVKPMYTDEEYVATFEVIDVLPKNMFLINTTITNRNNESTIEGEALIKYKNRPAS